MGGQASKIFTNVTLLNKIFDITWGTAHPSEQLEWFFTRGAGSIFWTVEFVHTGYPVDTGD